MFFAAKEQVLQQRGTSSIFFTSAGESFGTFPEDSRSATTLETDHRKG